MKIKNVSTETLNFLNKEWLPNDEVEITRENINHYGCACLIEAITIEKIAIISRDDTVLDKDTAIAFIAQSTSSSLAVDKNGVDQALSGNDWTLITSGRDLWDISSDYDHTTYEVVVPYCGIWFHDGQFRIVNISNCTAIELAIYKGSDYWFLLDKKILHSGDTEAQLSTSTLFDFYTNERYCLKIKLYGTNPTATISGDDDYTAWGYIFERQIYVD